MIRTTTLISLLLICLTPQTGFGQEAPQVFYGGGIGLGFGDVEYFELSPMIGLRFNSRLSAGIGLTYRQREDKRFETKVSTKDYGARVFVRFHISEFSHLQAEYEYLDYEFYIFPDRTERRQYSSLLAGGGVTRPIGGNTLAYATLLYNVNYDAYDSPYNDPWVYRFGVSVGF